MKSGLLGVGLLGPALYLCAGCATTEADRDAMRDAEAECVFIRQIRNYDVIDEEHIWVQASQQKSYLLTTWSRCSGIRFASAIAFTNTMGRLCSGDFGSVSYEDTGRTAQCRIRDVELVGSKGEATAIVADRRSHGDD